MEGDLKTIRCCVEASLSGYEDGPVDYLTPEGVVSDDYDRNTVEIRHHSVLAFLRFFYRRLMLAQED